MFDDSSRSNKGGRSPASQIAQGYRTAHEILSAAIALGLLTLAGYWLDSKLGWTPALTVCGACLGFVVGGVSLRVLVRRLDQESKVKKRKAGFEESQSK